MHSIAEHIANPADAALLARIATMRESVRGHKQRALAMWDSCVVEEDEEKKKTLGKFTEQLVQCE